MNREQRDATRRMRDEERDRRDAEISRKERLVAAACDAAPHVLPGDVGPALVALLDSGKPFRAEDGYMSFRAVSRTSEETLTLARAVLALSAEEVPVDRDDTPNVEWKCPSCGATIRARMADHPDRRKVVRESPTELSRTTFGPPGMVVYGDVLLDCIADAAPRYLTDDTATAIANTALDLAVRAGMTVLHGPDLVPRDAADFPVKE